jgi:hypothetical protein
VPCPCVQEVIHVEFATHDGPVPRPSTASAIGSGAAGTPVPLVDSVRADFDGDDTVITAGGLEVVVRHVLAESGSIPGPTLIGTWPDSDTPAVLAYVRQ